MVMIESRAERETVVVTSHIECALDGAQEPVSALPKAIALFLPQRSLEFSALQTFAVLVKGCL